MIVIRVMSQFIGQLNVLLACEVFDFYFPKKIGNILKFSTFERSIEKKISFFVINQLSNNPIITLVRGATFVCLDSY